MSAPVVAPGMDSADGPRPAATPHERGGATPVNAKDRLILALDVPSIEDAQAAIEELDGLVTFYKIGLTLQLAAGREFVERVVGRGDRVFLDYKYFDVPETIKTAVARAAKLGVTFLTVHGTGGIIRAAVEGRGTSPLKLLSVTVLTSLDARDIQELGYECSVEDLVLLRARKALDAGCDGVIASGREAKAIRQVAGSGLVIVTPGVRPEGAPANDQKRAVTPGAAILAGADYLVVGRPILQPEGGASRREAASRILQEMQEAFNQVERPAGA